MSEEDALRATAALHAATRVVESEMEKPQLSDKDLWPYNLLGYLYRA